MIWILIGFAAGVAVCWLGNLANHRGWSVLARWIIAFAVIIGTLAAVEADNFNPAQHRFFIGAGTAVLLSGVVWLFKAKQRQS